MFCLINKLTVTGANPAAVLESIENDEAIKTRGKGENSLSFDTDWFADSLVATLSSKFPDHELYLWSMPSNCSDGMGMNIVFFNGEVVEWFTDMDLYDNIITDDGDLTPDDYIVDCSENVVG